MKLIAIATVFALIGVSVDAWGRTGHEHICFRAAQLLPDEVAALRTFLTTTGIAALDEAAMKPDNDRFANKNEAGRHYDDLELPHARINVAPRSADWQLGVVEWALQNATRDVGIAYQAWQDAGSPLTFAETETSSDGPALAPTAVPEIVPPNTFAYTSFEDVASEPTRIYVDTESAETAHNLTNHLREPTVQYDGDVGSELGFYTTYTPKSPAGVGLTDGDWVGVTDFIAFPHGTRGFEMSDCDGTCTLVVLPATVPAGATQLGLRLSLFVASTGWESSDVVTVVVSGGGRTETLLEADGTAIESESTPLREGAWVPFCFNVSSFADVSALTLTVSLVSNAASEEIFVDAIYFIDAYTNATECLVWDHSDTVSTEDTIATGSPLATLITAMGRACHYAGDSAQPMHATANYDGQLTNQKGLHSRYESKLVDRYQTELFAFKNETEMVRPVGYVNDTFQLAYDAIVTGNGMMPSILEDDKAARNTTPTYNSAYYAIMWAKQGSDLRARIALGVINTVSVWSTAMGIVSPTTVTPPGTNASSSSSLTTAQLCFIVAGVFLAGALVGLYVVVRASRNARRRHLRPTKPSSTSSFTKVVQAKLGVNIKWTSLPEDHASQLAISSKEGFMFNTPQESI